MASFKHTCSFCNTTASADGESAKESWQHVKALGWRAFKEGDDWKRKCPSCVKSLSNRQQGDGPPAFDGEKKRLSYGELHEIVALLAAGAPPVDTGSLDGDQCCFCGRGTSREQPDPSVHLVDCLWRRAVMAVKA